MINAEGSRRRRANRCLNRRQLPPNILLMTSAPAHDSPIVFFVFLAVAAAVLAFTLVQAKRRRQALAAVAQQIGFIFEGTHWKGPSLSPRFKTCVLQRTRGNIRNAMVGSTGGLEVSIFDYSYRQGKASVVLTLACFSQNAELPPFELRPEGFFDKISDAILHDDQDFDTHPEFSRRYHLRTPDEKGTRKLFNPGLLTYFEQIPPDKKWHVEASGTSLILYRRRSPVNTTDIPTFLNETSAIARTILSSAAMSPTTA